MDNAGNTLSCRETEDEALPLAAYQGGASEAEVRRVIAMAWGVAEAPRVPILGRSKSGILARTRIAPRTARLVRSK